MRRLCSSVLLLSLVTVAAGAQSLSFERQRGLMMLEAVQKDLRDHYYDPALRGIDLPALVAAAKEKVRAAQSVGEIFTAIAQVTVAFDDSHTRFLPPERAQTVEYGWTYRFVGDDAYVDWVAEDSDAARQGVAPGYRLRELAGFTPTRQNHQTLRYLLGTLRPQPSLRVVVEDLAGSRQTRDLAAKVVPHRQQIDVRNPNDLEAAIGRYERASRDRPRHLHVKLGEGVHLWRMPFFDLGAAEVDAHVDRFRNASTVLLDLRGNGGGGEETMLRLLGNFFERDVTLGTLRERKGARPLVARARGGGRGYHGRLIVLVDSLSASAAEVVARVLQLESRATIVGDRTAGAVTRARFITHQLGTEVLVNYGTSVTIADLLHTDGQSLERVGVIPDVIALPAPGDLTGARDLVLARAAALAGLELDPADAARVDTR